MKPFYYLGVVAVMTAALFAVCFVLGALARLFGAIREFIFPPKSNP